MNNYRYIYFSSLMYLNATHEYLQFTIIPAVFLCNLCWSMLPVKGHVLYYPTKGLRFSGRWTAPDMDPLPSPSLRSCLRMKICRPARVFAEPKAPQKTCVFFLYGFGQWDPQTENCLGCLIFEVATLRGFYCVCILFTASSLAPTNFPNLRLESYVASNGLVVSDIV